MSGLLFSEPAPPSLAASGAAQQQGSRKALVNVTCGDNNLVLSIPLSIHPVVQTFLSHDYTVGTFVPLVTGSDPALLWKPRFSQKLVVRSIWIKYFYIYSFGSAYISDFSLLSSLHFCGVCSSGITIDLWCPLEVRRVSFPRIFLLKVCLLPQPTSNKFKVSWSKRY